MTKKEKEKLIVVESTGSLMELGGISGPIINPCKVPISTIVRMINNHRKVYEVNPAKTSERIRLSLKNVKLDNFPVTNTVVKANVSPVVNTENKVKENPTIGEVSTKNDTRESKKEKGDFTKK